MKLRTSYFNPSVLLRDCTRFAPAWGLYLIGAVSVTLTSLGQLETYAALRKVNDSLSACSIVNLCYALLCAQLLFGDLYQSRLCYALHAMPVRREGWFLTHVTAGLLFSLVPNLIGCLLFLPFLGEYAAGAFLWLAAMELQYLFFFGVAVLCAVCAGNRVAMAIFYVILNFLSYLVYGFLEEVYEPLLYGVRLSAQSFYPYSPVLWLTTSAPAYLERLLSSSGSWEAGAAESWRYTGILGGIGTALLLLALLLYRKRHLERAGDFAAFKPIEPVFCLLYTLAAGLLFDGLWSLFFSYSSQNHVFLILGILIGFFTGQMLLRRKVAVFQLRRIGAALLLCAVLGLSMGITRLDPLGITRRIPDTAEIASAEVGGASHELRELTDPADLETVRTLHQTLLEERSEEGNRFIIRYRLKNGGTLERWYSVNPRGSSMDTCTVLLSRPEFVLSYDDYGEFLGTIDAVCTGDAVADAEGNALCLEDPAQIARLMDAVRADCLAGRITRPHWWGDDSGQWITWLDIMKKEPESRADGYGLSEITELTITSSCTATLACLEELGYSVFWESDSVG